jgi:hypothetical protein
MTVTTSLVDQGVVFLVSSDTLGTLSTARILGQDADDRLGMFASGLGDYIDHVVGANLGDLPRPVRAEVAGEMATP